MNDLNYIRSLLKTYIDRKVNKFIIYPFGVNGVKVKNILKDYFNLEPLFIVDNEYSRYNPKIISGLGLKKFYQDDMYIILTVENETINKEIFLELSGYISPDRIINLKKTDDYNKRGIAHGSLGFLLKDFLPPVQNRIEKNTNKIKVRIVQSSPTIWNAINTVCNAFREDCLYDVLIIIGGWKNSEMVKIIDHWGYRWIMLDEYQGEIDKPDILVLCGHLLNKFNGLLDCRRYVKLVVVVYWSVVRYAHTVEEFWINLQNDFDIYRPDYYLFDSLQYKEIEESKYYSEKIIEMGNAKFDGIYQGIQEKKYPDLWKKLEGKTTVLWATSHGINENMDISPTLTFDLFAKTFFEYANNNPEMGFILRPAMAFLEELLKYGFWSENDIKFLKEYCTNSPNIIFDDTENYDNAISISDGVITDGFCGIVCSALPTLKPICATFRSKEAIPWHKELLDSLYLAYEIEDFINFLEMVKNKSDFMLEQRKISSEKFVKNFDGQNGWRIKEFIKEKYNERC